MENARTVLTVVRSNDEEDNPHNVAIFNGTGREIKDAVSSAFGGMISTLIDCAREDKVPITELHNHIILTVGSVFNNALTSVLSGNSKLTPGEVAVMFFITLNMRKSISQMLRELKDEEDADEPEDSDDSCTD